MAQRIDRVLVWSYYHPWIAGGGHRPHQLLLDELKAGREVAFIYESPTGEADIAAWSDAPVYTRLAVFQLSSGVLVPKTPFAGQILSGGGGVDALVGRWRPVVSRAHNPVQTFVELIDRWVRQKGIPFVYDQMDLWAAFPVQPWGPASTERAYLALADAVTTISQYLVERAEPGSRTHLLPNAINPDFLEALLRARRERAETPGEVVYAGAMWPDWFDWDLVEAVVRSRTDLRFTFVGAVRASEDEDDGRSPARIAEALERLPNVRFVDEVPHRALGGWLARADVGIVPFVVNPVTLACSPLKVFEYIGAGLQVVSSALPEIGAYPHVTLAQDAAAFAAALSVGARSRAWHEEVERFCRDNTWTERRRTMDRIVGDLL